jgi:hypothetical protein
VIVSDDFSAHVNRPSAVIEAGMANPPGYYRWLWLTLVLAVSPYLFLLPSIVRAYPYLVQDDARHFVVGLRRLADPGLYPGDIVADHFAALTPWLYRSLFLPFAWTGIDPVWAHLCVVMPLTAVLFAATAYVFVCRFWPSPMGAAVTALSMMGILGWRLGLAHDFGYSLVLLLMLGFWSRRVIWNGLLMIVATGLLPVAAATCGLGMALLMLRRRRPFLTFDRKTWLSLSAAAAGCALGGLVAVSSAGRAGPTFSAAEARAIPFFLPGGRRPFWGRTFASTYLCNEGAGIVPLCEDGSDAQMIAWSVTVAILLGLGLWVVRRGHCSSWLAKRGVPSIDPRLAAIWTALIASGFVLFVIAHRVAFALHMPQRFAQYSITLSFAMMVAMTASVFFTVAVTACGTSQASRWSGPWILMATALVAFGWLSSNSLKKSVNLVHTDAPEIHAYLRMAPKDVLVAGVVDEIDSVPAFGWRSVLGSMQLLVPYKKMYYEEMARRMTDLAVSLYAPEATGFAAVKARYGIDYVLVERLSDRELTDLRMWATNFPAIQKVVRSLETGQPPFFRERLAACERAGNERFVLADASCILEHEEKGP